MYWTFPRAYVWIIKWAKYFEVGLIVLFSLHDLRKDHVPWNSILRQTSAKKDLEKKHSGCGSCVLCREWERGKTLMSENIHCEQHKIVLMRYIAEVLRTVLSRLVFFLWVKYQKILFSLFCVVRGQLLPHQVEGIKYFLFLLLPLWPHPKAQENLSSWRHFAASFTS